MKRYEHFWIATLVRGILAMLVGSAVVIIPDMAKTILLLPFAVALSILGLATYGIVDSFIILATSVITSSRPAKIALRIQGACGILMGVALFSIVFNYVRLEWFLYLIALQAIFTAVSEFTLARHTSKKHGSHWNYAAAYIASACGMVYMMAAWISESTFSYREMGWLIFGYLVAFGMALCLTAARMLYIERTAIEMVHVVQH